jgi:hypothetical protein
MSSAIPASALGSPRPPVRYHDPILETIARSIYTFFPRCIKCGQPIESFEEADVRILRHRVVHRRECPILDETSAASA